MCGVDGHLLGAQRRSGKGLGKELSRPCGEQHCSIDWELLESALEKLHAFTLARKLNT